MMSLTGALLSGALPKMISMRGLPTVQFSAMKTPVQNQRAMFHSSLFPNRNFTKQITFGAPSLITKRFTQTEPQVRPAQDVAPIPVPQVPHKLVEPCFAVVHIAGSQYKISPGDLVLTHKLQADIGTHIILDKVLLVGTRTWTAVGTPLLPNAKVYATVEEQTLTDKVIVFKKKRRKNYKRTKGHRQEVTTLRILDVSFEKTN